VPPCVIPQVAPPERPQPCPQAGVVLLRPGAAAHAYASGTFIGGCVPSAQKIARFFLIPSRGVAVSDDGVCHHFHDCCHCSFSGDRSLESVQEWPRSAAHDGYASRSLDRMTTTLTEVLIAVALASVGSSAAPGLHQHGARRQSLALAISDANAGFIAVRRDSYSHAGDLDDGGPKVSSSSDNLPVCRHAQRSSSARIAPNHRPPGSDTLTCFLSNRRLFDTR
jgi:hypothetical protein